MNDDFTDEIPVLDFETHNRSIRLPKGTWLVQKDGKQVEIVSDGDKIISLPAEIRKVEKAK